VAVVQRDYSYWRFLKEEAGVQIDYIGGTSMGAVVGGLCIWVHASQIDSIFKQLILMSC
jgi:hypothetical protein